MDRAGADGLPFPVERPMTAVLIDSLWQPGPNLSGGDAKTERYGIRTLRLRVRDKQASSLREPAREANRVWNDGNDLSLEVF